MKWKCNKCKNIQDGMRRTRQGFKRCVCCGSYDIAKFKENKWVDKK